MSLHTANPSQTGPNLRCNLFPSLFYLFSCPIILKSCTEHGSDTVVLCAKIQNDWTSEMDALGKQDFTYMWWIFHIVTCPRWNNVIDGHLGFHGPVVLLWIHDGLHTQWCNDVVLVGQELLVAFFSYMMRKFRATSFCILHGKWCMDRSGELFMHHKFPELQSNGLMVIHYDSIWFKFNNIH